MEFRIPFFYYDLFARVVPGGLTLLALVDIFGLPPASWLAILPQGTNGPTETGTFVTAVAIGAVSYGIGVLYEAVAGTGSPLFSKNLLKVMRTVAFKRAIYGGYPWRIPTSSISKKRELASDTDEPSVLCRKIWNWLVHQRHEDAFHHAHRFSAESKLFLYSAVPVAVLSGFRVSHVVGGLLLGICVFLFMIFAAWSRQRRLAVQLLMALDELKEDDQSLHALQRACVQHYEDEQKRVSSLDQYAGPGG